MAADVEMLVQAARQRRNASSILGVLEAPMAQTLAVMEALLTSVVYCLDNKVAKQESSDK